MKCKICNIKKKDLTKHLFFNHKMSVKQYKDKYNSELYDADRKFYNGNSHRGKHQSIEQIKKRVESTKNTYSKWTLEQKQKFKDNISKGYVYHKPWNKNLTKKTSEKVLKNIINTTKTLNSNEFKKTNNYLRMISSHNTLESNKKISESNKRYNANVTPERRKELTKKCCGCYGHRNSIQQTNLFNRVKEIYVNAVDDSKIETKNTFRLPDILLKNKRIIIEYDGLKWHKDVSKDIERDKELVEQNYKILHYRGYQPDDFEIINDVDNLSNSDINGLYKENNKTILQII